MIELLTAIAIVFAVFALGMLFAILGIYYIGELINEEQRGDD